MVIGDLMDCLKSEVKMRLGSGEMTERALSRRVGISQPHLHNVLKGIRHFKTELADRLMRELGISVDDTLSHKKFADKYNLPFPLLADEKATVARSYGAVTDVLVVKFAKRYTFLIDPQGKIAKTYLQVDTSRHSQEIIDDLKKLKGA